MAQLLRLYIDSYRGLSPPAWILALVLLVNRAGSMVLPFLSLYLKDELNFSLSDVGLILSLFGAGSLVGSYAGGWLTDRYGSFAVQASSLIGGGICFFILSKMESFQELAIGVFLTTVVTDSLRPANSTAIANHVKPENLTKAYSLNRMAVNLGYSVGPAIGGFLAVIDYKFIFYGDALTCLAAGIIFVWYFTGLSKRQQKTEQEEFHEPVANPWRDKIFLIFLCMVAAYGVVFFQLFNTLPLYYRDVYHLSERNIGWLLALNGIMVFLIEMPLVHRLSGRLRVKYVIGAGALLGGAAYLVLNLHHALAMLVISMGLLSLSEILAMPFMTTYAVNRANQRTRGRYLGMYSVAYGIAFIAAPALGTFLIDRFGYAALWVNMAILSVFIAGGFLYLPRQNTSEQVA